ncbi:hypothetical protein H5410_056907 [Solanum commersonii]|uniref:Uncharacterized protein n=1 Tax=Solanum commersonii TaxID=4109 RepID=A0A9J5WN47_SOLCO|nr:hypothetical protein H5410_056907 [Solanum commersonii]
MVRVGTRKVAILDYEYLRIEKPFAMHLSNLSRISVPNGAWMHIQAYLPINVVEVSLRASVKITEKNNLNCTMDNNVDNTSDEKDEEFHEVEYEIFEEPNGINIINDQSDSIEEDQSGQQQQQENINYLVDTCECTDRLSPVEAEFN